jgi:hydrogenase maturation protease
VTGPARPLALIVGLGQCAAGDDGVGLAVIDRLLADALPPGVEVRAVAEASALVPLLQAVDRVVLVDAALAATPGHVLVLAPEVLRDLGPALSSHGLDVAQAVALARLLYPETVAPFVAVVAVTIARPSRDHAGLSAPVAQAVPRAAADALAAALG